MDKDQEIVYIGKKEVKRDTVAGTAIIWNGFGDVQEVPHKAAVKMLQHRDVWVTKKQFEQMQAKVARSLPTNDAVPPKEPTPPQVQAAEQKPEPDPETPDIPEAKTPGEENPLFAVFAQMKDEDIGRQGPKIAIVRELAGRDLSVEEVKEAWTAYNASAA